MQSKIFQYILTFLIFICNVDMQQKKQTGIQGDTPSTGSLPNVWNRQGEMRPKLETGNAIQISEEGGGDAITCAVTFGASRRTHWKKLELGAQHVLKRRHQELLYFKYFPSRPKQSQLKTSTELNFLRNYESVSLRIHFRNKICKEVILAKSHEFSSLEDNLLFRCDFISS